MSAICLFKGVKFVCLVVYYDHGQTEAGDKGHGWGGAGSCVVQLFSDRYYADIRQKHSPCFLSLPI